MADEIGWGIIGTGQIARKFAEGLTFLSKAELVAVGSRTSASANEFADAFGVLHLWETLAIMKTMDRIRAQWGLRYPME
jgi:predicted dehydrogenase